MDKSLESYLVGLWISLLALFVSVFFVLLDLTPRYGADLFWVYAVFLGGVILGWLWIGFGYVVFLIMHE